METTAQGLQASAAKSKTLRVEVGGTEVELAHTLTAGDAPLLLMLHGLGCSQRSFAGAQQSPELADRALLTLDLPGFGDSSLPAGLDCDMESHAQVALTLLDALGVKQLHLLGHSMGGAVALLLAQHLGKRLLSLVSVEGNLVGSDCGVSKVVCGMTRERFENEFFPRLKGRTPPLERAFTSLELARPEAFYKSSCSLVRWSESGELLQRFQGLDVPKLYVHGRRSKDLGALSRLQGVEVASIPESGHFPMNENPKVFYKTLGFWLQSIE